MDIEGKKALPKAAADSGKALWKFGTGTLPRRLSKLVFVDLDFGHYKNSKCNHDHREADMVWLVISGQTIMDVIPKAASVRHTIFEAVIKFFCNLTLKNIWNGFRDLLSYLRRIS